MDRVGQMKDKPFQTYEELVTKLRDEKKLTISPEGDAHVVALLKKHSYFSLVSGYKSLFKAKDGTYLPGTTIDDILALYTFDGTLRNIFFRGIQSVEQHIKSLLSYSFVKEFGDEQQAYLSRGNYDLLLGTKDEQERGMAVDKLIEILSAVVSPPFVHKYIEHQKEKHQNVPLWATIKAITFGSTSKLYSLCKPQVKSGVAREFASVTPDVLAGMLDMLTRVRNVCAHNERLYDFTVQGKRAIHDMPVHKELGIAKSNGHYRQGKKDLFAALICFCYLLDTEEFCAVVAQIQEALTLLQKGTKLIPPTKILSCMGFPGNWEGILPKSPTV